MAEVSRLEKTQPRPGELSPVRFTAVLALLVLYSLSLLSVGLRKDWRLLHEDNGAFFTSLALTHVKAGLAKTRAHDALLDPKTSELVFYGHHPPALALLLAAVFAATGSASVAVARAVPIAFHLASLLLLVRLLRRLVTAEEALFGGFFFATLPLSAFFGRMVGYEPLCLFAVLIQLDSYVALRQGSRRAFGPLALGIVLGGLVDWASFFFAGAIFVAEALDVVRKRGPMKRLAAIGALAGGVFLFDLGHLAWAGGGLAPLRGALLHDRPTEMPLEALGFLLGQLESFRRYFTHSGLIASVLALAAILAPRARLGSAWWNVADPGTTRRFVAVSGGAAFAYVAAAPSWAMVHPYWKFYFLPFFVASMVLGARALRASLPGTGGLVVAALVLEVLVTSAYMLHLRHTRIGGYAVAETAHIRERWLPPPVGE